MTNDEIKIELNTSLQLYQGSYKALLGVYKKLQSSQRELPVTFSGENEDYENHLLKAAGLKHQSIDLWRDSLATSDAINSDSDHYSAHMRLYSAEDFLKEHGFDRITDSLREAYVKADKEMNDLYKIKGNLDALAKATERLVRAFEGDETNCRRLLERQSKMIGIQ